MSSFRELLKNNTRFKLGVRLVIMLTGIFIMANGFFLVINSGLGVNPWNVLHLGISYKTGFRLGYVLWGVGLLLVSISYIMGIKPSIGTFISMFFMGFFVNTVENLAYIPYAEALYAKVMMNIFGIAVIGLGTAFYIRGNLGAGPRDSLMLALIRVSGQRTGLVRTFMETTVTIVGFLLGGPVGLGTLLFCIMVGWFIELGYSIFHAFKKIIFAEKNVLPENL